MNWKTACKIAAPAAACAGAFAFLVAPGRATRAQKAPFLCRNYAHRGLHTEDGSVPENSLPAFRAAREAGDTAAIQVIHSKFDRSTPEGEAFLRDHFAYFGYGYLDRPEQIVPNVPLLFYSFRVMVGAGCFFILLLGVVWWLNRKDRLADKRWLLWVAVWTVPLAYLASQAGWIVAEVGRQPWAIQDLMPVGVAASKIPSGSVSVTFFLFLGRFTALLVAELSIMFRQIKIGPKND